MKALLCVSTTLAILVSSTFVRAEDKNPKPAPLVRLNSAAVKDGKLTGLAMQSVTKFIDQTVTKIIEGKAVDITMKVAVVETANVAVEYSLKNTKATTAEGKMIAADDLAALVKEAEVVAVFPTASKPSDEAVKKMPKGTVLIEILAEKK